MMLFVPGLKSCHILPVLGLECEDFQSGTSGGPALPHCHFEGLMRHLAGLAMRDLDLLRGTNHDL